MAMKAVVTGATGMIGGALVRSCLANGWEVYALIRKNSKKRGLLPNSPALHVVEADLSDLGALTIDGEMDAFFHFGWGYTDKEMRDDPVLQAENIETSLQAVQLAHRLHCRKFIGAGSQAEYGVVDGMTDEMTPCRPVLAYGMAKLAAAGLCEKYCRKLGMDFIWGRIYSVYGIHDKQDTMIGYAIDRMLRGEEASFSAGTQFWNYLCEEDAGRIFYRLAELQAESGIYNVAHSDSRPLRQYIQTIKEICEEQSGVPAACVFAPASGSAAGIRPDVSKLMRSIGPFAFTDFESGIRAIVAEKLRKE